jgi:DNA-binding NtrC family response regulator
MVYGIAQRHGADLEVKSALAKGTAISMSFPLVEFAPDQRRLTDERTEPTRRLRLLLVDDDNLVLHSLGAILEADGHAVTMAKGGQSGIDALNAASACGRLFSAVITDLGMPHIDGRRVAAAAKTISPGTRVVLLTGWGQSFSTPQSIPEHVDSVLCKPPRLADIRAELARLCIETTAD